MKSIKSLLVLADGTVFKGEHIGAEPADGFVSGEVVFNTAMDGYQEVITDPSYAGQVIAFTYPHIGNYGTCFYDNESSKPYCRGIVVREITSLASNWRKEQNLEEFLVEGNISGISGVDTRKLTRHIRSFGTMGCAFGMLEEKALAEIARSEPGTTGKDLVSQVSSSVAYTYVPDVALGSDEHAKSDRFKVVAYDFGIKQTILRHLAKIATVQVVPATTPAKVVLENKPDGVLLSNGPGDPAALPHISANIAMLIGKVPIFGICLGHQLLACALGGRTFKLPFGHHGINHPVKHLSSNKVEITSQNHNYAVVPDSIADMTVTHINLNDGVIEGFGSDKIPILSIQYHPEAGPGPHDAGYLFNRFAQLMGENA